MRIVLDTNVLVSGLYNPDGPPGRIIDLVLGGVLQVLYDDRILREYMDVLKRPELSIEPTLAQAIVRYIRLSGERVTGLPLPESTLPDLDDLPFAEIAISGKAEAMVTGNVKHFSMVRDLEDRIFSPAQFLRLVGRR